MIAPSFYISFEIPKGYQESKIIGDPLITRIANEVSWTSATSVYSISPTPIHPPIETSTFIINRERQVYCRSRVDARVSTPAPLLSDGWRGVSRRNRGVYSRRKKKRRAEETTRHRKVRIKLMKWNEELGTEGWGSLWSRGRVVGDAFCDRTQKWGVFSKKISSFCRSSWMTKNKSNV